MTRGGRRPTRPGPGAALVATLLATAFFLVLVVTIGFRETTGVAQKSSSGYGVQELGAVAWVSGHLVYVLLLIVLIAPATRVALSLRRRRQEGDSGMTPQGRRRRR
jgi:ABC-type Fe3+ transport system permease subunit